jgi:hypothetical protein
MYLFYPLRSSGCCLRCLYVCTDCLVELVYLPCSLSYGPHVDSTRQAVDEDDVSTLVCFLLSLRGEVVVHC